MRTDRASLGRVHLGPLWAVEVLGEVLHVSECLGVSLCPWLAYPDPELRGTVHVCERPLVGRLPSQLGAPDLCCGHPEQLVGGERKAGQARLTPLLLNPGI